VIDRNYPAENKPLYDMIAANGAVLSDFALGAKPEPWHFPARNRLISGASLGVLVIESPVDSGALITAREAGEQGRDVFAIPGPIDTGRSSGCHKLIQDGAKPVQTVDDILSELGVLALRSPGAANGIGAKLPPTDLPLDQRRVLDLLGLEPRNVDSMIVHAGLSAHQVSAVLTLLEMRGLARRVPGNAFVRVL
jgi:DNA processing protein